MEIIHQEDMQSGAPMRVAVIDDEPIACREIKRGLTRRCEFDIETFPDGETGLKEIKDRPFDLVLCDFKLPGMDGIEVLRAVKAHDERIQVILMTAFGSVNAAIDAIQNGAFHFVVKPVKMDELASLCRRALETVRLVRETETLKKALFTQSRQQYLIGHSPAIQDVLSVIKKICSVNCNVLIQGESGTGKELTAKALHFLGNRREHPFIAFSCGGFSDELITNELFGHEKGAFTGAGDTKIGLLESAHNGTLFLDEVGLMPLNMQAKLLRFIQERNLIRVGGVTPVPVDVRLIAAGNCDLKEEVAENRFREDLYYRLKVVMITLPSLRKRKEDIPLLAQHFIDRYNRRFHKEISSLDREVLSILKQYPFPGNVRELENIIARAVALSDRSVIGLSELPGDLADLKFACVEEGNQLKSIEEMEKDHIRNVLIHTDYHKGRTAEILQIPRTTLWRKMKRYQLD